MTREVLAASAVAAPFVHYKRAAFEDPDDTPVAFALDLVAKDLDLIDALATRAGARMDQLAADRAVVREALGRLPQAQREALVLAYWGGLTADQIAQRAHVPLGTAKSRIRLGLERLRAVYEPV